MQTKKEQCLQLKAEGKTHEQIALIVWGKKSAKSNVSYYLNSRTNQKVRDRKTKYQPWETSLIRSISRFAAGNYRNKPFVQNTSRFPWSIVMKKLTSKLKTFAGTQSKTNKNSKMKYIRNKNLNKKNVLAKYNLSEENPYFYCTYTGKRLDIRETGTYHIDHIIPRSRGQELGMTFEEINSLDNLQLISAQANQAKANMTHDELLAFSRKVTELHAS